LRRSADAVENECDAFLFDQTPRLFEGLRRAVGVVDVEEIELAAVDAALLVDHSEVSGLGPPDNAVGGGRPAERDRLAELNFRVRNAGRVFGPRGPEALGGICGGGCSRLHEETTRYHGSLPDDIVVDRAGPAKVGSSAAVNTVP
jgi:hypothetical protein